MKILPLALCVALLHCIVATLYSNPSINDYGALPSVSSMEISPSGDLLAFRKVSEDLDSVLVVETATGKLRNRLDVEAVKPRRLSFVNDETLVLVASEYQGIRGSNLGFEISTAFAYNLVSNELKQLLMPGDVIARHQSGIGGISGVSADGRHIYLPAFAPEKEAVNRITLRLESDGLDYCLMRVQVDDPRSPSVHFRGSPNSRNFLIDDEKGLIVEELFNRNRNHSTIRVHKGGSSDDILSFESGRPALRLIGFFPGKESVLVSVDGEGKKGLFNLNLNDGELMGPLFEREGVDVDQFYVDIGKVLSGVGYSGFRRSYEFLDDSLSNRLDVIVEANPKQSVELVSATEDWKDLLVYVEGNGNSGVYLLYPQDGDPRLVAHSRPQFPSETVHPIVEYKYVAKDGFTIPALLTVPRDHVDQLERLPLVLLPHGGPAAYDRMGFDWLSQALANEGYLVVQPQYRGSSGFGQKHRSAGFGQWGRKMQDDLTDSVRDLVERKLADPERVAIVGASYGGYAALAGATFTPELYRCAVSINGVSDLPRIVADERFLYWGSAWLVDQRVEGIVGEGGGKPELRAVSPVNSAEKAEIPVLLVHGVEDTVVPFDQSKAMQKALKKAGNRVKLVKLDGEDHYLTREKTRKLTLQAVVGFLREHL